MLWTPNMIIQIPMIRFTFSTKLFAVFLYISANYTNINKISQRTIHAYINYTVLSTDIEHTREIIIIVYGKSMFVNFVGYFHSNYTPVNLLQKHELHVNFGYSQIHKNGRRELEGLRISICSFVVALLFSISFFIFTFLLCGNHFYQWMICGIKSKKLLVHLHI